MVASMPSLQRLKPLPQLRHVYLVARHRQLLLHRCALHDTLHARLHSDPDIQCASDWPDAALEAFFIVRVPSRKGSQLVVFFGAVIAVVAAAAIHVRMRGGHVQYARTDMLFLAVTGLVSVPVGGKQLADPEVVAVGVLGTAGYSILWEVAGV